MLEKSMLRGKKKYDDKLGKYNHQAERKHHVSRLANNTQGGNGSVRDHYWNKSIAGRRVGAVHSSANI